MTDNVNHPTHYAEGWSNGAEVIDITENLNFNRGNAVKYISRAGKKSALSEVEDLQKAQWYLSREIERLTDRSQAEPSYRVVSDDFWGGVDQDIVEAQEKRERDRTSRPPRVWDDLYSVPTDVSVRDSGGFLWKHFDGVWHWGQPNRPWTAASTYHRPREVPFTEVLDTEQKGSE